MIEIANIILQIFIFFIIFSFPLNKRILNNIFYFKNVSLGFFDSHAINIIFFSYFSLFTSLLSIDHKLFFKVYFCISLIFVLLNINFYYQKIKKENFVIFFFFFVIIFSIFIFIAQNLRLEWDGHVWISKALIFFNNEQISNLNETIHSEYPHLGTYLWAFFWNNSFLKLEYFGRFYYVYLYVVSIFLILEILNVKNNFIKIILIIFCILLTFEPYYFAGYQEYLIFSTLIIASRYIYIYNLSERKNIKLIFLIFLILYINCWFKNEGKLYFILFSIVTIYMSNIQKYKKLFFLFLVFFFIFLQSVLQNYLINASLLGQEALQINILKYINDIEFLFLKLFKIILNMIVVYIKHPLWIVIFLSIFIQIFLLKTTNLNTKYFLICLTLNLLSIIGVYASFDNIDLMLKLTLDRVLFQTSGFYLVIFFSVLNNKKFLIKRL